MSDVGAEPERMVWLLGLHRSGTTIVWNAFRANKEFVCFDEPLTDDLGNCFPRNSHKKTYNEYLDLFGHDPQKFWDVYNCISPLQELDSVFTPEQAKYLMALMRLGGNVVIDETHLHAHVPGMRDIAPDSYVIHLFRRARGYVTSHLRPDWSRNTTWARRVYRKIRHEYNNRVFWDRYDFLPGLHRGDVIGSHPQSKFGLMLSVAGYDADRIMSAPTLVRLLAYWHYHYHLIEREGPRNFGARFMTVRYEDFASSPENAMASIYHWLEMNPPAGIAYTNVHPPKPAFHHEDKRWIEAAKIAGFTDAEISTLL